MKASMSWYTAVSQLILGGRLPIFLTVACRRHQLNDWQRIDAIYSVSEFHFKRSSKRTPRSRRIFAVAPKGRRVLTREPLVARSLGPEVFGPKVQRTKGSLARGLLKCDPVSMCPGMISGFCSTDLLTA